MNKYIVSNFNFGLADLCGCVIPFNLLLSGSATLSDSYLCIPLNTFCKRSIYTPSSNLISTSYTKSFVVSLIGPILSGYLIGASPVITYSGHRAIPFSFLPSRATGDSFNAICIMLTHCGESCGPSLSSHRNYWKDLSSSLIHHSTVPFDQGIYFTTK